MYEVVFASKRVGKSLAHLPSKQREQIVSDIEKKLRNLNPLTRGIKPIKSLGVQRLRCGDFRVIFKIEGNRIVVRGIVNRKDVPY